MSFEPNIERSAPGPQEQVIGHRYCYPRAVEIRRCGNPDLKFPDAAATGAVTTAQPQVPGRSPQLPRTRL
jgi:hypothetical protein